MACSGVARWLMRARNGSGSRGLTVGLRIVRVGSARVVRHRKTPNLGTLVHCQRVHCAKLVWTPPPGKDVNIAFTSTVTANVTFTSSVVVGVSFTGTVVALHQTLEESQNIP